MMELGVRELATAKVHCLEHATSGQDAQQLVEEGFVGIL